MACEVDVRQATTPTIEIDVSKPLTGRQFRVAFEQRGTVLVKNQDKCELSDDGLTVSVTLTQEETMLFRLGPVRVQVRYGSDGRVQATDIGRLMLTETIDREVM